MGKVVSPPSHPPRVLILLHCVARSKPLFSKERCRETVYRHPVWSPPTNSLTSLPPVNHRICPTMIRRSTFFSCIYLLISSIKWSPPFDYMIWWPLFIPSSASWFLPLLISAIHFVMQRSIFIRRPSYIFRHFSVFSAYIVRTKKEEMIQQPANLIISYPIQRTTRSRTRRMILE